MVMIETTRMNPLEYKTFETSIKDDVTPGGVEKIENYLHQSLYLIFINFCLLVWTV